MPIPLLVTIELDPESSSRLEAAGFRLRVAIDKTERAQVIRAGQDGIRAVLTNGSTGFDTDEMAGLPTLEIVCALGAGYEKIDLDAARARGVIVTHGPGTNDATVADHALALLMAIARGIVGADHAVRRGDWLRSRQPRPTIFSKRLGVLGLGTIGEQIARRAAGGFDMPVAYHNRTPRAGAPWLYLASPVALAQWSDFMVVATPGGAATRHLVDADVLAALGPAGYLVNIARGSVVDTAALVDALEHGRIAGAALDVVEGEPSVPPDLARQQNVVLTPHIAGRSPEAVKATVDLVIDNLKAHFGGRPALTPVPGI